MPELPQNTLNSGALFHILGQLSNENQGAARGFFSGVPLAEQFFSDGSLGRVDEASSIDPATIQRLRRAASISGLRSPEAAERIGGLGDLFQRAQRESAGETEVTDLRRENLAGLTPEEEQLLRDQGQTGLNRGLQTALRSVKNNFSGATGAASTRAAQPIISQFTDAQRGLERDIGIEKIQRKRDALNSFENTVRGIQGDIFARSAATGDLFSRAGLAQEQFESQDSLQKNQQLLSALTAAGNDSLNRRQLNMSNLAAEKAGQIGLIFGSGQFGGAETGRREALAAAREAASVAGEASDFSGLFDFLSGFSGGGFGGGSSGGGITFGTPEG